MKTPDDKKKGKLPATFYWILGIIAAFWVCMLAYVHVISWMWVVVPIVLYFGVGLGRRHRVSVERRGGTTRIQGPWRLRIFSGVLC